VPLRCLGLLVQSGCLKSPAGDLVVVPGALAEDVAIQSDAELPVDGTGSNCDVVIPVTFPEQYRTALLARRTLAAPYRLSGTI
jgi:hypothetical protein